MGILKTLALFLALAFVPVMCADVATEVEAELDANDFPDFLPAADVEALVEDYLRNLTASLDGLYIPSLPTLSVNMADYVNVALSLNRLELTGISNVDAHGLSYILPSRPMTITFPKITLNAGHYSSGGHILNMPFAGEGDLLISIHNLDITPHISFGFSNSTPSVDLKEVVLHTRRLEVEFSNMNPGSDQGQLINIVLSSFGPDILTYLEQLINRRLVPVFDEIVVDLFKTALCPDYESYSPLEDDREMAGHVYDIYQHFLMAFKVPKGEF